MFLESKLLSFVDFSWLQSSWDLRDQRKNQQLSCRVATPCRVKSEGTHQKVETCLGGVFNDFNWGNGTKIDSVSTLYQYFVLYLPTYCHKSLPVLSVSRIALCAKKEGLFVGPWNQHPLPSKLLQIRSHNIIENKLHQKININLSSQYLRTGCCIPAILNDFDIFLESKLLSFVDFLWLQSSWDLRDQRKNQHLSCRVATPCRVKNEAGSVLMISTEDMEPKSTLYLLCIYSVSILLYLPTYCHKSLPVLSVSRIALCAKKMI